MDLRKGARISLKAVDSKLGEILIHVNNLARNDQNMGDASQNDIRFPQPNDEYNKLAEEAIDFFNRLDIAPYSQEHFEHSSNWLFTIIAGTLGFSLFYVINTLLPIQQYTYVSIFSKVLGFFVLLYFFSALLIIGYVRWKLFDRRIHIFRAIEDLRQLPTRVSLKLMSEPECIVRHWAADRIENSREVWLKGNEIAAKTGFPTKIENSMIIYCTGLVLLVITFLVVSVTVIVIV